MKNKETCVKMKNDKTIRNKKKIKSKSGRTVNIFLGERWPPN